MVRATIREGGDEAEGSPTGADESFALLPDPGIKVVYEDIESLVVDLDEGKRKRLMNDTKCTLVPHTRHQPRRKKKPLFGL